MPKLGKIITKNESVTYIYKKQLRKVAFGDSKNMIIPVFEGGKDSGVSAYRVGVGALILQRLLFLY